MKKALLLVLGLSAISVFAVSEETSVQLMTLIGGPQVLMFFGLGFISFIIGLILAYVGFGIGLMRLSKKLAPDIHPIFSWIPILQLIPFVAITGRSLWWIVALAILCILGMNSYINQLFVWHSILGIIMFIIIVFLYYSLSRRLKRGIGTTVLLVFFSVIMIPYLGCVSQKKPKNIAFAIGVPALVLLLLSVFFVKLAIFTMNTATEEFGKQLGKNALENVLETESTELTNLPTPPIDDVVPGE